MAARKKSGSRKSVAKKAAKTRKSRVKAKKAAKAAKRRVAAKKAAKAPKRRVAARKAVQTRKPRVAVKKSVATPRTAVAPPVPAPVSPPPPAPVTELDNRIAIVRANLRELVDQAASSAGAANEELLSQRIAEQEERLKLLMKERDELPR
jgi:hypothetical protein